MASNSIELMKEIQFEQDMKADRASVLSSAEKDGHGQPHETKSRRTLGTQIDDPGESSQIYMH